MGQACIRLGVLLIEQNGLCRTSLHLVNSASMSHVALSMVRVSTLRRHRSRACSFSLHTTQKEKRSTRSDDLRSFGQQRNEGMSRECCAMCD